MLNAKQIKTLQSKKWTVKENGFYITIYSNEVDCDVWEQICEQVGVSSDATEVTILGFGITSK